MKIAFPHMGTMTIAFMGALRNLNVDVVVPQRATKNSELVGFQHSPEFVCLPFKLTLSNFIEALEEGADTLVMIGGSGPCRLGFYSVVQEEILREMGYSFQFIRADDPDQLKTILETMKKVSGIHSLRKLLYQYYFIMKRLDALDEVVKLANRTRPFELKRGETSRIAKECEEIIDKTTSWSELRRKMKVVRRKFTEIQCDWFRPVVTVGILGEIFIVLENVANTNIEESLGNMGVLVHREVTVSNWFNERVHYAPWRTNHTKKAARLAKPYLKTNAGGESLLSVGKTVQYAKQGLDGVVHLLPFSCMPEMIAQSIMGKISRDYNLPVLHLTFDEHTTEMGYNTRIEAFVDMLQRRKFGHTF